ncbi:GNAT family N-acetyltransferase [Mucilaginibacter sp. 44-25]|uniref:GNAT family N-acetyltransferase n=1 Tax=Mucilaginibacter sp. 44-25 TaxID=1895794 RepID=UPI00096735D5|nr:GNAT family N-acetyltransferase [Mucilaginibacter sp. 44-25]OJW18002.1 MAG: GNAT family N-acetyltransferase [Mucilaginibacter sp. 44-25]
MKFEDIELVNNEAIHNFELMVDGHRSFIDYQVRGEKIYLIHTEVPEVLQGRGVAEALVEKAFTYIESKGQKVVPLCAYVQIFLKKHPEWNRIVA